MISLCCIVLYAAPSYSAQHKPRVAPDGWVHDFAYDSDQSIGDYLLAQYQIARSQQLTAYVYIYDDRDRHCRVVRTLMKRERVANAYKGSYMIMLNAKKLKTYYKKIEKKKFGGFQWTPLISKLGAHGGVTSDTTFPDFNLFHEYYGQSFTWNYAKRMKKYFEQHNDF